MEQVEEFDCDFEDSKDVEGLLQESQSMGNGQELVTELLAISYGLDSFSHGCKLDQEKKLQYETEYLIAGKSNDYANVKSVVNRLLAMRFAMNFAFVTTDSVKNQEALAMATALVGFTANPAAVAVVKYLLLAAVSYGESLLDVKTLFQGGKVPLVKNSSNFTLSLKGFASQMAKGKIKNVQQKELGLDYDDYLKILFCMQQDKEVKYFRMLDVMEVNIRQKKENFRISNMVFGFTTKAQVTSPYRQKPVELSKTFSY